MWCHYVGIAETKARKVDTNRSPRHLLPFLGDFKRYTVGGER